MKFDVMIFENGKYNVVKIEGYENVLEFIEERENEKLPYYQRNRFRNGYKVICWKNYTIRKAII